MDFKPIKNILEEMIMADTIYSFFQSVVQTHRNETAIIENQRTMTFGELSNLVDIIAVSYTHLDVYKRQVISWLGCES